MYGEIAVKKTKISWFDFMYSSAKFVENGREYHD